MQIGLIRMISTQKTLKTYNKIGFKIALFGHKSVVATPLFLVKASLASFHVTTSIIGHDMAL